MKVFTIYTMGYREYSSEMTSRKSPHGNGPHKFKLRRSHGLFEKSDKHNGLCSRRLLFGWHEIQLFTTCSTFAFIEGNHTLLEMILFGLCPGDLRGLIVLPCPEGTTESFISFKRILSSAFTNREAFAFRKPTKTSESILCGLCHCPEFTILMIARNEESNTVAFLTSSSNIAHMQSR